MSNRKDINQNQTQGGLSARSLKQPVANTMRTIKKYRKAAYLTTMSEAERDANLKVLENMNKRVNYLKNPRYKTDKAPILMSTTEFSKIDSSENPFSITPRIIQFQDCKENAVYELPLKVTNKTGISQRIKFVPPKTEYFAIGTVKYPSKETGLIAPGMTLYLTIRYSAPGLGDLDDEITFITEENSFKVPIIAQKLPPELSMENPIVAAPCWLGVRSDKTVKCTNIGGETGFNLLPGNESETAQDSSEFLKLGPFSVYPSQFYLQTNDSINLVILYAPETAGEHTEELIIETAFQTRMTYQLKGVGCTLNLEATALDAMILNFKENPLTTIHFDITMPNLTTNRKLKIRNNCGMKVQYHWSIYKNKLSEKISLSGEEVHFTIEPLQGTFNAYKEQEFTISFNPLHAESYFEYADLIIDDIPIQAVPDASDSLKVLLNPGIGGPSYLGSNTRYPSFPYLSFSLEGYGDLFKVTSDPPIFVFPEDLTIMKEHTARFKLLNESHSKVNVKIYLKGKTSEDLTVQLISPKFTLKGGVYSGTLSEAEEEVEVKIESEIPGEHKAYFVGTVEDGNPFSFEVCGCFTGPRVRVYEKNIDFGLVRTQSKHEFTLNVENLTDIEAEVLIKSVRNRTLTFDTVNDEVPEESDERYNISTKNPNKNSAKITIKPEYKKLAPFEKTVVLVTLETTKQETIEDYLEVDTKYHDAQYLSLHAEVQKPYLSLNQSIIDLGVTYAGLQYRVDERHKYAIVISNHGNLDTSFEWENNFSSDEIEVIIEPSKGLVKAKSEQLVTMAFTFYKGGKIEELIVCNIEDMELPLGFLLRAETFGLTVSYEVYDEAALLSKAEMKTLGQNKGNLNTLLPPARYDSQPKMMTFPKKRVPIVQDESKDLSLKEINFLNARINKVSYRKFIMKNNSGLRAAFTLHSVNYEPTRYLDQSIPQSPNTEQKVMSSSRHSLLEASEHSTFLSLTVGSHTKSARTVKFALSTKSKSTAIKKRKVYALRHPLLTEAREQEKRFTSAIGETYTATRKVEQEQNFYLENNKGVAVVCHPYKGELAPHSEMVINVTLYNNACGKYEDKIISEVKGMEPFVIPVNIDIKGTPIVIPSNQVGLYYNEDPPALVMKPTVKNGGKVTKTFKIENTGIHDITINWKIFDMKDIISNTNTNLFTLTLRKLEGNSMDPYKVDLEAIEPKEESKDSPFTITQKQLIIPAKEKATFEVTFDTAKSLGAYNSVLLAHPQLAQEDPSIPNPNLGVVYLTLRGQTVPAHLTIDKKYRMDGVSYIHYDVWPSNGDNTPSLTKKIGFINESPADIAVNLATTGPFELVSSLTNSPPHPLAKSNVKVQTLFNLLPGTFLEVGCRFIKPNPNNYEKWPLADRAIRSGTLQLNYANTTKEEVVLEAQMLRPRITIHVKDSRKDDWAEDEFDFGITYMDKERYKDVVLYLKNESKVDAKWTLNYVKILPKDLLGYKTITRLERENLDKTDDQSVFAFSVTEGTLQGPSTELTWLPQGKSVVYTEKDEFNKHLLPQEIMVKFIPKESVFYKSKFRITVENGISSEIILKGTGAIKDIQD